MRRTHTILATAGLLLLTTVTQVAPSYCRIVTSARSFQRNFRTLGGSSPALNPVERFVFSLMLVNTKSHAEASGAAGRRTT